MWANPKTRIRTFIRPKLSPLATAIRYACVIGGHKYKPFTMIEGGFKSECVICGKVKFTS